MAMEETQAVQIQEHVVLSKFEGDPLPENEFERIHITNGEIVAVEQIQNGLVISSQVAPGGRPENVPPRPPRPKPRAKGVE